MESFAAGLAGGAEAGGFVVATTEVATGSARSMSGSAVTNDACTNGGLASSANKFVTLRTMQILICVLH